MQFNWPLMKNNITKGDLDILIEFLQELPHLTQASNVLAFEREWSEWLGVRYSVFVNSGSSANLITMAALKHLYGSGEIKGKWGLSRSLATGLIGGDESY